MASIIQIKRGTGSAVPSGLADGELAINLDNGQLYFGSGSTSVNDFKFNNITVNQLTSSIVTSSIIETSGSNIFGDDSSDTHLFRGNITASGNISSSGIIIASNLSGTNTGDQDLSSYSTITQLNASSSTLQTNIDAKAPIANPSFTGNVTASGNISSSGDITANRFRTNNVFIASGDNSGITLVNHNTAPIQIGKASNPTTIIGNVTASGNISASGNITTTEITASSILTTGNAEIGGTLFAARIHPNGSSGPFIDQANDNLQFSTGIKTLSHITASGDISSSGTIFTDTISSPTNNLIVSSSTVTITSTTDNEANLILESDTDNNDENDNPFMSFKQDGGAIEGQIGLSGDADKWPDGTTLTGVTANAMVIGMSGDATSTNRQLYLAAGNTASLEIKNDADVHIMNGNLNLDGTNALFGNGHLIAKFDSEIIIGAGNRPIELNSTTTEINGLATFTSPVTASIVGLSRLEMDDGTEALINMYQAGTQRVKISGRGGQDSYFNAGDVAIGTDTPAEKLTVEGNISSSGTVTADRFLGSQLTMVPFNYFVSSVHSSELYVPQGGSQVESTSDQPYHFMLAPYDGKVRRVSVYYQTGNPGDLTARVRAAAAPFDLDDSADIVQAETISSAVDDTAYFFDFSASFSKGDAVALTFEAASHGSNSYVVGCMAVEYDTTT